MTPELPPAGPAATPQPAEWDWLAPPGPALKALRFALHLVNRALMRGLFRLSVDGLDRLPPSTSSGLPRGEGPLVLVCNHASDLDGPAVAAALPWASVSRGWWGGENQRVFTRRARRLAARVAHLFPVDDRASGASLAPALEVLRRGGLVVWFPEEWRSPDGTLQPFLTGVGWLVKETGAQAVPVLIRGTFEALPRGRRLPRLRPLRVVFGAPLEPETLEASGEGKSPEARIASALHAAVAALGGEGGEGDWEGRQ
ncbi:MAG: lysophospholipid acyltransferase family protein [Alphaproteobacteria bacterium]